MFIVESSVLKMSSSFACLRRRNETNSRLKKQLSFFFGQKLSRLSLQRLVSSGSNFYQRLAEYYTQTMCSFELERIRLGHRGKLTRPDYLVIACVIWKRERFSSTSAWKIACSRRNSNNRLSSRGRWPIPSRLECLAFPPSSSLVRSLAAETAAVK